MAANGASIATLRDFCNDNGIPGRRDKIWNSTSWKDLLYDHIILKYAGYGVWNVRKKDYSRRSLSDCETEPNAHPAIITDEVAQKIMEVRSKLRSKWPGFSRSSKSDYLLTGGISVCSRCGKNLIGNKTSSGCYYVCGSEPYRGGKGCGPGVYVPKQLVEDEVITGIQELVSKFSDPVGFTRKVNRALKKIWRENSGHDPTAEKRIRDVDVKIANIRQRIEDGYNDVQWANARLAELNKEKADLQKRLIPKSKPIQIEVDTAMKYRKDLDLTLSTASPEERKIYVQKWLGGISLNPDSREVLITFKVPDFIVNDVLMARRATILHPE
jgi:hypothetical protein